MKAPHTPLSPERILAAALHLIDAQGLRRLTMRRLGDALEVEAMAIYHHFPRGKEQLLDALVEHVSAVPGGTTPETDWRDRLCAWARAYRSRVTAHPGLLPLLVSRSVHTPATRAATEAHYAAFHDAGLRGAAILDAARALDGYVIGYVILEVQERQAPDPPVDGRHPHTAALAAYRSGRDGDAPFEAGLDAVLSGLRDRTVGEP